MRPQSKYSKEFKINALRAYKSSGLTPTEFAMKYNKPDSTFFDWVKKYEVNECWLEVTDKVEQLTDTETFSVEGPKPLVIVADMLKEQPIEEIMTMTYRGITISFHESILNKVLEEIKEMCLEYKDTPIVSFSKAVSYILKYFDELSTFLDNPMLPIHNNKAERTVGYFVLARKNFQTISTTQSAVKNLKLFTIVQTARSNGLNVEKYLNYVFENLALPIDELLPYSNKIPESIKLDL